MSHMEHLLRNGVVEDSPRGSETEGVMEDGEEIFFAGGYIYMVSESCLMLILIQAHNSNNNDEETRCDNIISF